ncbi:MAG: rRNA maturation RNase YbeY [Verrucomicrobiota bacterium]
MRIRPLQRRLDAALKRLPRPLPARLREIHIVLVDREIIARIHADFLGDPTETDVITFPYGEIVVCPAVAQDRARELGHKLDDEVLLYALHGLLHLAGYDDTRPKLAKEMAAAQEKLLAKVLSL